MSSDEGVWWIWRGHFTELFLGLGLLLSHCWGAQVRRSPLKVLLALSESAAASLYSIGLLICLISYIVYYHILSPSNQHSNYQYVIMICHDILYQHTYIYIYNIYIWWMTYLCSNLYPAQIVGELVTNGSPGDQRTPGSIDGKRVQNLSREGRLLDC